MRIHEYNEMMRHLTRREPNKNSMADMETYDQGGRVGYKPGGIVEPGVMYYATEYLSNKEFSSLYKKFKGTDKEFADSLNKKGYKAKADKKFNADSVYSRRDRLGLESKGYVRPTIKDFKKEAKELGINIKGFDDQKIKQKVRDERGDIIKRERRLTDPDFVAKERATQKAWQEANPEKYKEAQFQARVKSYEKIGMIQPVKNAKEELWRSLFEDGKKYQKGRRLKMVGNYGRYVSRERFLDAEILDTKTNKKITFKNLEKYINPKNTGKTYAEVIKPFDQKWFINEQKGLRTEINSKLIPNWTKGDKRNFFEIQHNAGRYTDPFDVSLGTKSTNIGENTARVQFEKRWNKAKTFTDKKNAFKIYKETLPEGILSKPSMVTRSRYFGEEGPLDKQLRTLKKESGVKLPRGTLKKVELLFQPFCNYGNAEGGRIGFKAGSCSPEVAKRNFLMATDDVAKGRVTGEAAEQIVKNAGKVVAKAGSKSALMSFLGPAGFGLDIAFEVGSIGTDMAMDSNVTLKGALQNNWLTGFFMKGTGQEEYHKGLFAKDSSAKPLGTAMDLYARIEQEEKTLKRMTTGSDRATTTEEMLSAQKDKINDLYSFFDKLARKEGGKYLAFEEGSREKVAYQRAKQEYDSAGAANALLKRTSKAGFEQMVKEGAQKRPYSKYGYEEPEKYGEFTKEQLDQALKWSGAYGPYVSPQTFGLSGYEELSDIISNQKKRSDTAQAGGVANMAAGGRVSFKGGGMGRRAFLKLLTALGIGTATAGTGLIKLGGKAVGKKVIGTAGVDIATGTPGMPDWFVPLVNKIIKEGDDVTAKIATQERQVVHTKNLPDGESATVYRNTDTGDIRVEYDSVDNMGQEPISLEYRKGQEIYSTGKGSLSTRKTTKEPDKFGAYESEPKYEMVSPDDAEVQWEGGNDVGNVDDLFSDTTKLKNYAEGKKPTIKEIVTRKRKTDEVKKLNEDTSAQVDYSVNKYGEGPDYDDYLPDIDDID